MRVEYFYKGVHAYKKKDERQQKKRKKMIARGDASVAGYRGPSDCLVFAMASSRAAVSTAYITANIYFGSTPTKLGRRFFFVSSFHSFTNSLVPLSILSLILFLFIYFFLYHGTLVLADVCYE